MGPLPGQKTVLITGCSPGGIGFALAKEFHDKGLHVIATARDTEKLSHLAAMGISTVALEIRDKESIARCHREVTKITGGKLDILVNNAGRTHILPALDVDLDDARDVFETNVFGIMAMVKTFIDLLMAAKGLIINVASLAAITPYLFGSVYCASKGALISYSRTLRAELKPLEVRVMVSMTGTVKSLFSHGHHELGPDSLYQCVRDVYERRLSFSRRPGKMPADVFAKALVRRALAPEVPTWMQRVFGRPDWFWGGGLANITWVGTMIGEWIIDAVTARMFGVVRMVKVMRELGIREQAVKKITVEPSTASAAASG